MSVTFQTPAGEAGAGQAVALTQDTGYFWFFNASNAEVVVKVLNACSFDRHFWVFAGGLTNVLVDMRVEDTQTGAVKRYLNLQGRAFQPIQDTAGFSTCVASSAQELRSTGSLNGHFADPVIFNEDSPSHRLTKLSSIATVASSIEAKSLKADLPALHESFVLAAPDASTGDLFGIRTKVFNDFVAVGAWFRDDASPDDIDCNSGAVYLFRRDQGGANRWGLVKKIMASDAQCKALFGYSLALSGDTLAVGAYGAEAAYVFQRNVGGPDNWGQTARLTEQGQGYPLFGTSVALDHDDLAVGAPADAYLCPDKPNICLPGVVYFFHRASAAGPWSLTNRVTAPNATPQDIFGESIAGHDGTFVVSAFGANDGEGLGYLYQRMGESVDSWQLAKIITPSFAARPDGGYSHGLFGRWPDALDFQDDVIAGGSPVDSRFCAGSNFFCGSVHIFSREAGVPLGWPETQVLSPPQPVTGINFGGSVGLDKDIFVVFNGAGIGSADVFFRSSPTTQWTLESELLASDLPASPEHVSAYSGLIAVGSSLSDFACPGHQNCDAGAVYLFDYAVDKHRCRFDDFGLCLSQSRFRVTTAYRTHDAAGPGRASLLTSDTGYFWFFGPENVELLVKVLDGCSVNGHYWVFAGGLTNVSVEIGITDMATGVRKLYVSPLDSAFSPLQDTLAFPCQ